MIGTFDLKEIVSFLFDATEDYEKGRLRFLYIYSSLHSFKILYTEEKSVMDKILINLKSFATEHSISNDGSYIKKKGNIKN